MAEISVTSSEENKCALKIPITRKNSSKSHSGSESSELLLSGDDTCSSSGFRSGQTSDLGRITICRGVFFKKKLIFISFAIAHQSNENSYFFSQPGNNSIVLPCSTGQQ